MAEIEARHRIAARQYERQYKPTFSWAPIWDGTKFVAHAWTVPHGAMILDHEQRLETVCGIKQPYPRTFVASGEEPHCEKCMDVTLEPLARAFAECEAQGEKQ